MIAVADRLIALMLLSIEPDNGPALDSDPSWHLFVL